MKFLRDPVEQLLYISLAVLMLIIILSAIGVSVRLHDQQQIEQSIEHEALLTRQHTDCVALLLTQPHRATVRIQDLTNCRIGP